MHAILIDCCKTPTTIKLVVFNAEFGMGNIIAFFIRGGNAAAAKRRVFSFVMMIALAIVANAGTITYGSDDKGDFYTDCTLVCPSDDWYSGCYTGQDWSKYGYGQSGQVDDDGCGSGMKVHWQCTDNDSMPPAPSVGNGQHCWCRLKDAAGDYFSVWMVNVDGGSASVCATICPTYCADGVAHDSGIRSFLCAPPD
jgi:hypothetical protein